MKKLTFSKVSSVSHAVVRAAAVTLLFISHPNHLVSLFLHHKLLFNSRNAKAVPHIRGVRVREALLVEVAL
jgi:hypothetical protein